jgi:hypothetical protein
MTGSAGGGTPAGKARSGGSATMRSPRSAIFQSTARAPRRSVRRYRIEPGGGGGVWPGKVIQPPGPSCSKRRFCIALNT